MRLLAETIVSDIRHHMLEGEADSIYSVIREFNSVKNLQKIEILKVDGMAAFRDISTVNQVNRRVGKVIFQREKKPEERILPAGDPSLQRLFKTGSSVSFLSGDSESRILLFPLMNEKACYKCHGSEEKVRGILFIKRSTSQTKKTISSIKFRLFIGFLTTFLVVALFLWFAIKRMVVMPINNITKNAALIANEGLQD